MTDTVLVVGASGFLGRSLVERLRGDAAFSGGRSSGDDPDRDVLGTYCSSAGPTASVEFDFWTDDVADLVAEHDVDTVVFAAAVEYGGDIDTGESDVAASFTERAERFATGCADTRLVYVSSASVFDGTAAPYGETDSRSPRDDYGRRLVAFEDAVREHCDDAAILRTSYLYGFSTGRLDHRLAETRECLDRGESVTYFSDMHKSPVLVTEAAETGAALVDGDVTGVLHVPAPRVSVYEFHCEAMAALDYDPSAIESEPIPADMDVAPDLTLTSDRFGAVAGFEPSAVEPGLRSQLRAGTDGE
jgi:dTDP-4-dehydrorhamnose reductase